MKFLKLTKETWNAMIIELLVITIPLIFLSPALTNFICNYKKEIQFLGQIKYPIDVVDSTAIVVIAGVGQDTARADGKFSFNIQTSSPRFKFLGCSTCEKNTEFTLEVFTNNTLYKKLVIMNNEAIKSNNYQQIIDLQDEN